MEVKFLGIEWDPAVLSLEKLRAKQPAPEPEPEPDPEPAPEKAVPAENVIINAARCPDCGGPGYVSSRRTGLRHKEVCRWYRGGDRDQFGRR
jgi:hypothetical protein